MIFKIVVGLNLCIKFIFYEYRLINTGHMTVHWCKLSKLKSIWRAYLSTDFHKNYIISVVGCILSSQMVNFRIGGFKMRFWCGWVVLVVLFNSSFNFYLIASMFS